MAVKKKPNLNILLGSFIVAGLIALVLLVFLIGRERKLFDTRVELLAHFPNVAGLAVGADVMLSGVVVGHVDAIKFPILTTATSDEVKRDITVVMHISRNAMEWIRKDSVAHLDSKGLLGDKLINISIGSVKAPQAESKSMLESAIPPDLSKSLEEAQKILSHTAEIFQSFKNEGRDALISSIKSIKDILKEVQSGQGALHELIYSKTSGQSIKGLLANVENITSSISKDMNDKESKNFIQSLNKAAMHLEELAKDINNGHGSLGLLIKDPSLYNELYGLIGNLRRNTILKAIIRYNLSKQEKEVAR